MVHAIVFDDNEVEANQQIQKAVEVIKGHIKTSLAPQIGIICGSGMSRIANIMHDTVLRMPYSKIPGFPRATVAGHDNTLLLGKVGSMPVFVLLGRFHYYEGHSLSEIVFPVRVMAKLGIKKIVITNSAGALNTKLRVGDLVVIEDHISFLNLAGVNPLRGPNLSQLGPRFPSLVHAYHRDSYKIICEAAQQSDMATDRLHRGIYVMVGGPTYETPAETRLLRQLGGDVVGMSTVPEVTAAIHAGMEVIAFSLVSNLCVDQNGSTDCPRHEDVLAVSDYYSAQLERLISALITHPSFL